MTPTKAIVGLNSLREIVRTAPMRDGSDTVEAVGICNELIRHFQGELKQYPVCPACGGTGIIRESIERPVAGQIDVLCPCKRKAMDPEIERQVKRDFERVGEPVKNKAKTK